MYTLNKLKTLVKRGTLGHLRPYRERKLLSTLRRSFEAMWSWS